MKKKQKVKLDKLSTFERVEQEYEELKKRWLKDNPNEEVKSDQSKCSTGGR